MKFEIETSIVLLRKTPGILRDLLSGLPPEWTINSEGGQSWSPKEILAHLLFGEQTDWMPRVMLVLSEREDKRFEPFDMNGHEELSRTLSLGALMGAFEQARTNGLDKLEKLQIGEEQLDRIGIHSEFGPISLRNHLAAWVVHDLGHIAQITRVMAKQYREEVGPWTKYMSVLNDRMQNE
jgi:hypothetical protein